MIEAYLNCAVWKGIFIAAFLALGLGSILGHFVWGRFRSEGEPWWRSLIGVRYLLRAEYYRGDGGPLRAMALGLSMLGSLLLLIVVVAVAQASLSGSATFCGFQL